MSYVSGLIAGSQPSKSDSRSFSKPLPNQFLLQIKLFRGPKLPKQHFKAQKNKIDLKMSKNGFRLDASDRENCALRTAPASLQNFWPIQTGRHSAFCLSWEAFAKSISAPSRVFWLNNLKPTLALRAELRRAHPTRPRRGGPQTGG